MRTRAHTHTRPPNLSQEPPAITRRVSPLRFVALSHSTPLFLSLPPVGPYKALSLALPPNPTYGPHKAALTLCLCLLLRGALACRRRLGLFGLLVVYPATTIPVALYMLQGYFRGLPSELEEAGLMDGLNRVQVIMKITLPLALPALASVSLYVFMIAWNEFLFAFMFLDNLDMFTLSRGVVSLNSSEVPRQHLMAGAVVATVPVLAIFLWFEKYLVSGLTAGSVKG